MAKWYEAANEASFKRVADGNVFQSPNPWLLARPRYYVVNDAKKAEIMAHLGRWRLVILTCMAVSFSTMGAFVAFAIMAPATFARLLGPLHQVGVGRFTLLLILVMILSIAPLVLIPHIFLIRGLKPLLSDAARTDERIKMREQLPKIAQSVSAKVLAIGIIGGLCMMGGAVLGLLDVGLANLHARNLMTSVPILTLGAMLTGYFVYLARLKAAAR